MATAIGCLLVIGSVVLVNSVIAFVIQFVWNSVIVKATGVDEISFLMAWLIGLVIYWLFKGAGEIKVRVK